MFFNPPHPPFFTPGEDCTPVTAPCASLPFLVYLHFPSCAQRRESKQKCFRLVDSCHSRLSFSRVACSSTPLFIALFLFWLPTARSTTPTSMSTRPAYTLRSHGTVMSMTVEPARAPTPTLSCSCALGPMPEKSTIIPSGTALCKG